VDAARRRYIVESLIATVLSEAAQTIRRGTGGLSMLLHYSSTSSPRICMPTLVLEPNGRAVKGDIHNYVSNFESVFPLMVDWFTVGWLMFVG